MMRCVVFTLSLVTMICIYSAYGSEMTVRNHQAFTETAILSRQKRFTCDVLSYFKGNHTACALHCKGHGYRGGYCNNKAVCVCRR